MRATLWLFNKHFWKSIYGPVMAFVFPPLLLVIMGHTMTLTYVLPGIIAMAGMFIGILSMPLFIMEMKGSTLLKYVGSSPLNSKRFTISVVIFYLLISVLSVLNILLFGMFFFWNSVFPEAGFNTGLYSGIFSAFGSFSFWIANILHIAMSLGIGLIIVTYSKTVQRALAVGLMISIPSMFISGMVVPVDVIANSTAMQWLSRLTPFRYSTGLLVVSSTPQPQMGDFIQHVSPSSLGLIFNNIDNSIPGLNRIKISGDPNLEYVTTTSELSSVMDYFRQAYPGDVMQFDSLGIPVMNSNGIPDWIDAFYTFNVNDKVLFNDVFITGDIESMASATNNIFSVWQPWGVIKTPDIEVIQSFVQEFLYGVASYEGMTNDGGLETLLDIQVLISNQNWDWMEIFFKQTTTLYTISDMVLNLTVPVAITTCSIFVAMNKFKWSGR